MGLVFTPEDCPDDILVNILRKRGYAVIKVTEDDIRETDIEKFNELTKHVEMDHVPIMPIVTKQAYLDEYNLILKGESKLSASQRQHCKNVINADVRAGKISLKLQ